MHCCWKIKYKGRNVENIQIFNKIAFYPQESDLFDNKEEEERPNLQIGKLKNKDLFNNNQNEDRGNFQSSKLQKLSSAIYIN